MILDDSKAEAMTLDVAIAKVKLLVFSDDPCVFGRVIVNAQCDKLCENLVQSICIYSKTFKLMCAGNPILEQCNMEICIRDQAAT